MPSRLLPFIVSAFSSAALLVGILSARGLLSRVEFGYLSLLFTLSGLSAGLGALGMEQVVLRTAHVGWRDRERWVEVDPRPLACSLLAASVTSAIAAVYWNTAIGSELAFLVGALCFSIALAMVAGNLLRLSYSWIVSQVCLVGWRIWIAVPFVLAVATGRSALTVSELIPFVLAVNGLVIGFSVVRLRAIRMRVYSTDWLWLSLGFLMSMGTISFLGQGDRILVELSMGTTALGDYLFCWTVLGAPMMLVTSYVGFKELVYFKESFQRQTLSRRMLLVAGFCGMMYLCILLLVYGVLWKPLLESLWPPSVSRWVALPFGFMVVVRGGYAILSAYIGARGDARALVAANTLSLAGMCIAVGVYAFLVPSLLVVAWIALFAWVVRAWTFWAAARHA